MQHCTLNAQLKTSTCDQALALRIHEALQLVLRSRTTHPVYDFPSPYMRSRLRIYRLSTKRDSRETRCVIHARICPSEIY